MNPHMCYEALRLRTFRKHRFTGNEQLSGILLAKNGFYYDDSRGRILCFSCGCEFTSPSAGEMIDRLHASTCQRLELDQSLRYWTSGLSKDGVKQLASLQDHVTPNHQANQSHVLPGATQEHLLASNGSGQPVLNRCSNGVLLNYELSQDMTNMQQLVTCHDHATHNQQIEQPHVDSTEHMQELPSSSHGPSHVSNSGHSNDVVTTNILANNVLANNVVENNILPNNVLANNVLANNVVENNILANNVSSNNVSSNNIPSNKVLSNNLSSNYVSSNTSSSNNLYANNLSSDNLNANNLSSDNLCANNVSSNNLSPSNLSSNNLSTNKVSSYSQNTVLPNTIASNNLLSDNKPSQNGRNTQDYGSSQGQAKLSVHIPSPYLAETTSQTSRQAPASTASERRRATEHSTLSISSVSYPQFSTRQARIATFSTWNPAHSHRPEHFAELGFYYAGYADCVRCFCCGLGMKFWRPEDDIRHQHNRLRPDCAFNRLCQGQTGCGTDQSDLPALQGASNIDKNYLSEASVPPPAAAAAAAAPSPPTLTSTAATTAFSTTTSAGSQTDSHQATHKHQRPGADRHQTRGADRRQSSGTDRHQSSKTDRHQRPGTDRHQMSGTETHQTSEANRHQTYGTDTHQTREPDSHQRPGTDKHQTDIATRAGRDIVRAVERENVLLAERTRCRICQSNSVGCIFLPCGHVASCPGCADNVTRCVVCNKIIIATANIYLS